MMISQKKTKIFGIGLSRTGTQSLSRALRTLEYRTAHYPNIVYYRLGRADIDINEVKKYDAVTDIPVARFYKELDIAFPGSKFILTIRNAKKWVESCNKLYELSGKTLDDWFNNHSEFISRILLHFFGLSQSFDFRKFCIKKPKSVKIIKPLMNLEVYSSIHFDKRKMIKAYKRHIEDVILYFSNRKNDLLIRILLRATLGISFVVFLGPQSPMRHSQGMTTIWKD